MNPKITLLMALVAAVISAGSAQHHNHGHGSVYGPVNSQKSSKVVEVGSQTASNDYSQHSSNRNSGYNTVSKVDIDETQIAQKESRQAPPPPPVYAPARASAPAPAYAPAPSH